MKPVANEMTIRGRAVPVTTLDLPHTDLTFFVENPRVYSMVRTRGEVPTQEDIQSRLQEMDHVLQLVHDIKANGGLMDPLIVRDGTFEVLEGNSRLAAYRKLAESDPIRWSKVRCTLLPADIAESEVFALLGQYHVKGKKAWAPFEQAGFLYRRLVTQKLEIGQVAHEIGLSTKAVKHLVDTYEFMLEHKEPPARWSYYDEYLKSSTIRKAREEHPKLDGIVVQRIKSGEFRAVDLRDELPKICKAKKLLHKFAGGNLSFNDAVNLAKERGGDNSAQALARNEPGLLARSGPAALLG